MSAPGLPVETSALPVCTVTVAGRAATETEAVTGRAETFADGPGFTVTMALIFRGSGTGACGIVTAPYPRETAPAAPARGAIPAHPLAELAVTATPATARARVTVPVASLSLAEMPATDMTVPAVPLVRVACPATPSIGSSRGI